jgi:RNA polymerase sigma-70 factor (ECF subfamily)
MSPSPKSAERSDADLMVLVQADDADAFAALYDRHSERAFRVARAVCRDRSRAEDAVQEGFLSIWRNRRSYRPDAGSFQAWSMKIVQNSAIDSSRNAATRPPPQIGESDGDRRQADTEAVSPPDNAIAGSEREALLALLRRLPGDQAEVIVLAFYAELSHSEIARQLDLPTGTVKGRMRLGMAKLRREMATADSGPVVPPGR